MLNRQEFSFSIDGVKYSDIKGYKYNNSNTINIPVAGTAQMIRQWLKQKYPSLPSRDYYWIKSESYSGGNSINIYLNDAPEELFKKLDRELNDKFEEGKFNGMDDSYTYTKSDEKSDEGMTIDYGTKYLFVKNSPPYGVNASSVDWSVLSNPTAPAKATTSKPFTRKSSSSSGSKFDRGMMIKECAGWEIYKKDYGKNILYSAVKKPETPKNKTDWDIIKGEIYTESGFSYKFGSLQKYGLASTITPQIEELCKILSKYYQSSSPAPTTTTTPTTLTKEKIDTLIKGLDVLIKRGNAQAELKKKAYLIIRNRLK